MGHTMLTRHRLFVKDGEFLPRFAEPYPGVFCAGLSARGESEIAVGFLGPDSRIYWLVELTNGNSTLSFLEDISDIAHLMSFERDKFDEVAKQMADQFDLVAKMEGR